ncbi:unnamed protein product, partial [Ectocarpus sp. 12 AP-2014]
VLEQQTALLEDTKCAKVAEACPEGSTSLLVKRKWFDPRGGCAIASCVHLETGDGGAGGARDTERTAAQADGSDDENMGTPEASGDDVTMKAIAEKLAAAPRGFGKEGPRNDARTASEGKWTTRNVEIGVLCTVIIRTPPKSACFS